MRLRRITGQSLTSFVAAGSFVGLALALALIPVPYVTWSPGGTSDTLGTFDNVPLITVSGTPTYPTSGRLDLTVVSVSAADARLPLPQAVAAYWLPDRDALPRDVVYPPGTTTEQAEREDTEQMDTAQDDAVVAALRQAGQPVVERPAVASVVVGGAAHTRLLPGDLVLTVDGTAVQTPQQVSEAVGRHRPGETVAFEVLRDRARVPIRVRAGASPTDAARAAVGITVGSGYEYAPEIGFDLGRRLGGPSAGLVFAVAIYDKITPGALLDGRHVAGTGSITADGQVGGIGGIQEKIAGADEAGASAFLVPADNCDDLSGVRTEMTLVRVATLDDAVRALQTLARPDGAARAPRCP